MALPPLSLAILDTETTGFLPRTHRVIELAIMRIESGQASPAFDRLFSIGEEEIPPHVRVLTRINPADIADKPRIGECLGDIEAALAGADIIVGQNVCFDIDMLKGEGIDLTDRPCIDTAMLAALAYPELSSYSLQYMSRALKLHHEPAHRAMGDVRATAELLEKCWERFLELPEPQRDIARDVMGRSSEGYRRLFAALPKGSSGKLPTWFTERVRPDEVTATKPVVLASSKAGTVTIQEEHVTKPLLGPIILDTSNVRRWVAVKNIETAARQLCLPQNARMLMPPPLLPDDVALEKFLAQAQFTADEATVALKLRWFAPKTRLQITLHGGERMVWNGKIACTEDSDVYRAQFLDTDGTVILDHRQLLSFSGNESHAAHAVLKPGSCVVIDDASMLEDTATKAYGSTCPIADLRAAAEGHAGLTRFTDLLELWAEAIRRQEDVHYITKPELDGREAKGLREQTGALLAEEDLPERARHYLEHALSVLDPSKLSGRIVWIETLKHGAKTLHAVPERVDATLETHLYARFAVTLLSPEHIDRLPEIVPVRADVHVLPASGEALPLEVRYSEETLEGILKHPPQGKTIVLATSKRMIEDWFVRYAEALEEGGIELICQGLSGGQGRMEETFLSAEGSAIWILTPWLYESVELPTGSADRLVIDALPFDHPSHPILSVRAKHYRDAFDEYTMPRLRARIFRLLRTFSRHRTREGSVIVLDKRMETKAYGRLLKQYIADVTRGSENGLQKGSVQQKLF